MDKYDVIIIGAGIGGLTCGCYLSELGFNVLIIEQHHTPGGYCTSFSRGKYRFDTSVHYLGSVKRGTLSVILDELDLKKQLKFKQFDPTDKIIMPDNVTYVRASPFDTIEEFKKSFPEEKLNIEKFFTKILKENILAIRTEIANLTFSSLLNSYFNDDRIKATLSALLANMGTSPDKTSALAGVIFLKEFILDPGYYPAGGIQAFTDTLVNKLKKNKGELILSAKVTKIVTKEKKVTGVLLEDGRTLNSRIVVSGADATLTYKNLLSDEDTKESSVVESLKASSSAAALYIGINVDLSSLIKEECNIWHIGSYDIIGLLSSLNKNLLEKELPYILVYFPSLHDESVKLGSNTIQALINAPFESKDFWKQQKTELIAKMFQKVKKIIPGLKDEHVDVMEGASPYTFYRYTLNHNGAIYGWESTLEQISSKLVPQLSSLEGLILAGHWCTSGIGGEGGISGVATLGRNAARIASGYLKKDWPWQMIILK
ncbi:MAG: NAD(P)/FAD-dependent oxidoreductase [Candidatus Omnitrophota bacterium]